REGEIEREHDGARDEYEREDQPRRDEEVRGQPLAPEAETGGAADRPSREYRHVLLQKRLDRRRELVERVLRARLLEHDRLKCLVDLVVDLARVRAGVVERLAVRRAVEDRLRVRVRDLARKRLPRWQREPGLQDLRLVVGAGEIVRERPRRVRVLRLRGE